MCTVDVVVVSCFSTLRAKGGRKGGKGGRTNFEWELRLGWHECRGGMAMNSLIVSVGRRRYPILLDTHHIMQILVAGLLMAMANGLSRLQQLMVYNALHFGAVSWSRLPFI